MRHDARNGVVLGSQQGLYHVTYYKVKNWDYHFMKADNRKVKRMTWVGVPTKHDGKGFRRIAAMERNAQIFTAWILLLQVAAKMPVRGTLCDEDGPLTAEDLELKTGFQREYFELAFTVLTGPKVGWLERIEQHAEVAY